MKTPFFKNFVKNFGSLKATNRRKCLNTALYLQVLILQENCQCSRLDSNEVSLCGYHAVFVSCKSQITTRLEVENRSMTIHLQYAVTR